MCVHIRFNYWNDIQFCRVRRIMDLLTKAKILPKPAAGLAEQEIWR